MELASGNNGDQTEHLYKVYIIQVQRTLTIPNTHYCCERAVRDRVQGALGNPAKPVFLHRGAHRVLLCSLGVTLTTSHSCLRQFYLGFTNKQGTICLPGSMQMRLQLRPDLD